MQAQPSAQISVVSNTVATPNKKVSIVAEAVNECIDQARLKKSLNIRETATHLLAEKAKANPDLMTALTANALYGICSTLVGVAVRGSNGTLRSQPVVVPINAAQASRAKTYAKTLLDHVLPNGKELRYAMKSDIAAALVHHKRQIQSQSITALWLESIMRALKTDTATVGQCMTASRLQKLQDDAEATIKGDAA